MKVCYRHRGAISVFLCLILLPTLVFGALVTDAVRIYHSEGLVSEAGELAMNAGLSHYDMELKDVYGLFAMNQTPEEMEDALEQYFTDTIRASGLEGAGDISSLLDLKCESFGAYGVTGSEIYQTEAEKQQILEYMKYRAPVCIGEELIGRLMEMKSAKKQVDAMESQMEFAESMEGLQEACENANAAIAEYCAKAEDGNGIRARDINYSVREAENYLKKAAEYFFVMDVYGKFSYQGDWYNGDFEDAMELYNREADILMRNAYNPPEGLYRSFLYCCFYQKGLPQDLTRLVEERRDIYTAAGNDQASRKVVDVLNEYVNKQYATRDFYTQLKKKAEEELKSAWNCIMSWYTKVSGTRAASENAAWQLRNVKSKFGNARTKHQNWKNRTEALDAGDLKRNMKENAAEYEQLLREDGIDDLLQKIDHNTQCLRDMERLLREITFCNLQMTTGYNNSVSNRVQNTVSGENFSIRLREYDNSGSKFSGEAARFVSNRFQGREIPSGDELRIVGNDPFYQKLKEICKSTPKTAESDTYDRRLKELLVKMGIAMGDGIDELTDPDWSAQPLPSEVIGQGPREDADQSVVPSGGDTDREGRKEAIEGTKNSLGAMSGFIDGLVRIMEQIIEKIYIAEYGIQMFSYFTVDKSENGTSLQGEITSLSNDDLTERGLYRGEVEYILWGKKNIQENVRNTKYLLYGIRMIFNLIYTFTDGQVGGITKLMAAALSCGVAFLIPVFEVVIKVALAGAETAMDVSCLMAGKKVPLIKRADNAHFSLNTLTDNQKHDPLGMSYRDYLTVFLLIQAAVGEQGILARIADCIQLDTEMDITQGYTMISVQGDVSARTTFMSRVASLPDGSHGAGMEDWYHISYQSVLGY